MGPPTVSSERTRVIYEALDTMQSYSDASVDYESEPEYFTEEEEYKMNAELEYWTEYEEYMRNLPEVQEELDELSKAIDLHMRLKDVGEETEPLMEDEELSKAIDLHMRLKDTAPLVEDVIHEDEEDYQDQDDYDWDQLEWAEEERCRSMSEAGRYAFYGSTRPAFAFHDK